MTVHKRGFNQSDLYSLVAAELTHVLGINSGSNIYHRKGITRTRTSPTPLKAAASESSRCTTARSSNT